MTTQPVVRQRGTIVAVQLVQRGGVITATSGVTLTLTNAADFPRDGGLVLIEGEATPRVYESVTEGLTADDPDVLNLTDPAPVINADTRADLYPAAWDMWADVEAPETGGAIRAIVPHNLRAVLPEGVRELAAREVVEVELDGWTWRLRDVLGRRGEVESSAVLGLDDALTELHDNLDTAAADLITARDALEAADVALGDRLTAAEGTLDTDLGALGDAMTQLGLDLANLDVVARIPVDGFPADRIIADTVLASKVSGVMGAFQSVFANKVVASMITADVSMANKVVGLMGSFGSVFANAITSTMLNVDTALVQKLTAKFATVQELFAGVFTGDSIRGGKIEGTDIYSPSSVAFPQIHINNGLFEVNRGEGQPTITVGGATSDSMQMTTVDGAVLAGFDADGNGTAGTMALRDAMTIGGDDVMALLNSMAQGVKVRQRLGTSSALNSIRAGNLTELGTLELGMTMFPGRLYRAVFAGMLWSSVAGEIALRWRRTYDSGGAPGAPIVTPTASLQQSQANYYVKSGLNYVRFECFIRPSNIEYQRVLLTMQPLTSGAQQCYISSGETYPADLYIEDAGVYVGQGDGRLNTGGATPVSGGAQPPQSTPPPQPRTDTWNAEWIKSWRGSSAVTDALQQGQLDGFQRYSMVKFPAAVQTALNGAPSITKMELYLENLTWWQGSGGKARIGRHQQTSAPTSPQTSGGGAFVTDASNSGSNLWPRGAGKWVTLPSDWYSRFAVGTGSGGATGITLGEGAGSDLQYYGKFRYSTGAVKLRATYTK